LARSPASPRHRLELALIALVAASVIGLYLVEGSRLLGHLEGYRLDATLEAMATAVASTALEGEVALKAGSNPVALLKRPPAGYRGERPGLAPADSRPGSWYYDPNAGILVHRPEDPTLLTRMTDSPPDSVPHLRLRLVAGERDRLHLRQTGPWRRFRQGHEP